VSCSVLPLMTEDEAEVAGEQSGTITIAFTKPMLCNTRARKALHVNLAFSGGSSTSAIC
jgi:hypothetical protein